MKITILTLFPEMFDDVLHTSIVGRAIARGLLEVECVQIRDFARDTYRHVDDTPFGGGAGMVMKCQPVLDALAAVDTPAARRILLSPAGTPYNQAKALALSTYDHLILLCGHYEGMDERISRRFDEEISIGDYVLSGGEIGAMVIVDSVTRLLKGAIQEDSLREESFANGLLEYPQYTQPADYHGDKVPSVLLSGNHARIRAWRHEQALLRTARRRPDLLQKYTLSAADQKILKEAEEREDGEKSL